MERAAERGAKEPTRGGAHDIKKRIRLVTAGQNEMEAMAADQVLDRERRCEFVVAGTAVTQSSEEARAVVLGRVNPQVDVLRKGGSAVKDGGLAANEQVLDGVVVKALEKVCDHGRLAGRPGGSAWPRNDADARLA
jgi:hypothetical protein